MAHMSTDPASTTAQSVSVPTRVGTVRVLVSPRPSCPKSLSPQHHRDPSPRVAQVNRYPATTFCQSSSVPTRVGVEWLSSSPVPSSPSLLGPQHHRLASSMVAQVWLDP